MAFHLNFEIVKEHPYAVAGVVLVGGLVLYLYWTHNSNQSASTTNNGTAVYGTPTVDPSVQTAEINAAASLQASQNAVNAQTAQNNFQLMSDAQSQAASLQLAQLQAQASTTQQVNSIQGQQNLASLQATASTTQQTNSIQGQEVLAGIQATLDSQNISSQQSMFDAQLSANTASQQANDSLALNEATLAQNTALQVVQANAAQNVALANINASVATAPIQASVDIANLQAQLQGQVIANNATSTQQAIALIQSGQLNKGGAGGANQVAILGTVLGAPGISGPAYSTATASLTGGNSQAGIISSIGGAASNVLSSLFK